MEYEIYIDVFAMTNFGMDLLALFLTDIFLGRGRSLRKMVLPSLFGTAVGMLLFFLLNNYGLYTILIHFLVNPCMVWMAFKEQTKRRFLEDWGVAYLLVLLSGGIMQWIYSTVFHGKFRMAAMLLTVLPALFAAAFWRYQSELGKRIYEILLFTEGGSMRLLAYYDTGNLLMDPYVKEPVSIIAEHTAKELLNQELPGRLIVYSSLGENHGMINAYTLEKMLIYKGKRIVTVEPVIIGVANDQLFSHGEYQMILNSHLL